MDSSAYPRVDPGHVARIAMRTCVGCRQKDEQRTLLRVVAVKDEVDSQGWHLHPDPSRCREGRGAYLHYDLACARLALQRKAFGRALRKQSEFSTVALMTFLAQQLS